MNELVGEDTLGVLEASRQQDAMLGGCIEPLGVTGCFTGELEEVGLILHPHLDRRAVLARSRDLAGEAGTQVVEECRDPTGLSRVVGAHAPPGSLPEVLRRSRETRGYCQEEGDAQETERRSEEGHNEPYPVMGAGDAEGPGGLAPGQVSRHVVPHSAKYRHHSSAASSS